MFLWLHSILRYCPFPRCHYLLQPHSFFFVSVSCGIFVCQLLCLENGWIFLYYEKKFLSQSIEPTKILSQNQHSIKIKTTTFYCKIKITNSKDINPNIKINRTDLPVLCLYNLKDLTQD